MNAYGVVFAAGLALGGAAVLGAVLGALSVGCRLFPRQPLHRPHLGCCRLPLHLAEVPVRLRRTRRHLRGLPG